MGTATTPPKVEHLQYDSLAQLYEYYINYFVNRSPIVSACGCHIHCYEHHFVHIVKLFGPEGTRIFFPDEKPKITTTTVGFGDYLHEARRASRLGAMLECLKNPDMVRRPKKLQTADRVFIKQFDCSQYPYIGVLVGIDKGRLILNTGHPLRRGKITSWLDGEQLFLKTAQPPVKTAV